MGSYSRRVEALSGAELSAKERCTGRTRQSHVKRLGSLSFATPTTRTWRTEGASISDIRDALGHESDKMARHHAGEARKPRRAS